MNDKSVQTRDPNAPRVIDIKLHVYEDNLQHRWYRETARWPDVQNIRYLGLYEGELLNDKVPFPKYGPLRDEHYTEKEAAEQLKALGFEVVSNDELLNQCIETVLSLARDNIIDDPEMEEQARKQRQACDFIEDFFVNHVFG